MSIYDKTSSNDKTKHHEIATKSTSSVCNVKRRRRPLLPIDYPKSPLHQVLLLMMLIQCQIVNLIPCNTHFGNSAATSTTHLLIDAFTATSSNTFTTPYTRSRKSYKLLISKSQIQSLNDSNLSKKQQLLNMSSDDNSDSNSNSINCDGEVQYFSPNNIKTQPRTIPSETEIIDTSLQSSSVNEYSFFDEAIVYVRAGSGGHGSSTYKKSGPKNQNGVPDGGNGGNGGDVYLVADDSLNTLAGLNPGYRPNSFGGSGAAITASGLQYHSYRPLSFRADNGWDGERQFKNGKYGKDVFIRVPPSTIVQEEIDIYEEVEGEEEEDSDENSDVTATKKTKEKVIVGTKLIDLGSLGELDPNDENAIDENRLPCNVNQLLVARGGDGGEGSGMQGYKKGRGVRRTRASPVGGERKRIKLTLRIVADVALVGVPNAGKSTFLASVTRAKPKIANYPFTTVIPNLGVWIPPKQYNDAGHNGKSKTSGAGSEGLALCDVPGLIAGAADGIGLGHAFLRHVERCHVILHLVDATSSDPIADFHMVNDEILRYGNGKLAQMPQIVVVNKVDVWEEGSGEEWERGLKTRMDKEKLESKLREAMTHSRLMWMSAKEKDGVDDLMGRMAAFVKKVKAVS